MASWELALQIDGAAEAPVFVQIAKALTDEIRRGRLPRGARLPGTRTLARTIGVHRNTVVAAYAELAAEGWIMTQEARGAFVAEALPVVKPRRFSPTARAPENVPKDVGFSLPREPFSAPPVYPAGTLMLGGGGPDLSLVPGELIARAYRRALRSQGKLLLDYGDPRGQPKLRNQIASMLAAQRGLTATDDEVLVTRGAQMGLDLIARALLTPDDHVAVESFGYRPAWEALGDRAKLVPIPVDENGLDVAALARRHARWPVRAVYLTPHHQYPTMVVLSASRRLELLAFARQNRIAVIEDDYDNEVHYQGRPVLPLASADHSGVVIYVGTLSKILAPGLRLGYVVAPRPFVDRLAEIRRRVDRQGDQVVERAVAELFEDGEVQRHARRMRRVYAARREVFAEALTTHLGSVLEVSLPAGGLALWLPVDPEVDLDAWAARSAERGVVFGVGRNFAFDGAPVPRIRLGFASSPEAHLMDAVRRMAAALPVRPAARGR